MKTVSLKLNGEQVSWLDEQAGVAATLAFGDRTGFN